MGSTFRQHKRSFFIIGAIFLVIAASFSVIKRSSLEGIGQTVLAHMYPAPSAPFPDINESSMTTLQKRIIELSKDQYAKKPVSFDTSVMQYSQGNKESWCADYVSWIFKQAGQPLSNPNSGSWRIPGVATLQSYYQEQGSYHIAGSYTPKPGDVAIYQYNRSHTNIVIAVHGDQMTTIGGNETGHLRLNTQPYKLHEQGLSGFGSLQ